MSWFQDTVAKIGNHKEIDKRWAYFVDSIDEGESYHYFRILHEFLGNKTFLTGNKIEVEDIYLADKLKIPAFYKVLSGKVKPYNLCRWFNQIFSFYPNENHEHYVKKNDKIDGRLVKAIRENDMKMFSLLIAVVDINAREDSLLGPRAIHVACEKENLEALTKLIEMGASIETLDQDGLTPIFYSIQGDHMEIFEYLLSLNANIHHIENQKRSLLYWAGSSLKLEYINLLLEKGCDPNVPTKLGRTCLSKAAWNGNTSIVRRLLESPKILLETLDSKGRTPLHNACWGCTGGRLGKKLALFDTDSPDCARLLILAGANRGRGSS